MTPETISKEPPATRASANPASSTSLFDLTGRTAVVTGTRHGLGQDLALALAKAGADLVLTSRTRSGLAAFESQIRSLGRRVITVELDVRYQHSIEKMVGEAESAFGRLDILVNNAGCNIRKPALEVTWEDWNTILDTNLRGSFFVTQAVARRMVAAGYGRIINMSSIVSVAGYAGLGPNGASRGGIRQLTMSLADDWGKYGVTVNCLAPGWFRTEQNKALYEDKAWLEYLRERIPVKRTGEPNDLDGAIIFLASESSRYMTGQTLLIDGGISTGALRAVGKPNLPHENM
jgi:gluconate 5-dehydrogenase